MHTHCLIPQARSQLQERGGAGTRETLTRVGTKKERGKERGLPSPQGGNGSNLVHLPFDEKSGRLLPALALTGPHGEGVCSKTLCEEHRGPEGWGVSNVRVGTSGDGEIKQLRRRLKPSYTRESPPPPPPLVFALAGVLGDSSVAKPLIGAASPGNPNYRPWRDGCAWPAAVSSAVRLPPPHPSSSAAPKATTQRRQRCCR